MTAAIGSLSSLKYPQKGGFDFGNNWREILKQCPKCGSSENGFYMDKRRKSGLKTICKKCVSAVEKAWRKANPEKEKARREANQEQAKAWQKAWYKVNQEQAKAWQKAYRKANQEKAKATRKAWYEANKEKVKADAKAWREANPEQAKDSAKAWCEANPEKVSARHHNRRARLLNAEGRHTAEDIKRLMELQKGKCPACRGSIRSRRHIDHVIPLAKGGTNNKSNIQLLCPTCNNQKYTKDPINFMREKGFLL